MDLIVPMVRSAALALGCITVHQIGEQPTRLRNSRVSSLVKLVALSVVTLVGKPVNCHKSIMVSQQLLAVRLFKATAWGNLEV